MTVNNMDHEAHKTAILNYLVASPPDLCFWSSGNSMRSVSVKRGLFEDISDLVAKEKYKDVLGVAVNAVTVDGKQYGLPTSALPWGLFYRKDVFAEQGLTVPETRRDESNGRERRLRAWCQWRWEPKICGRLPAGLIT